ncbi:hypothetical protein CBU02nite_26220 [Clostridium butyricum]|uniref:Uncharacterized protein n=1 Tax=Clostridium butyricum TaxID=1492 RepID=A0A512TPF2_CLOBU|nr:hypothetical protein [Clostridium butyricum]NOW24901.1 transcriptional regulator with XRE-family HTH domain [Clostridium butyricum]GEQ22116.1 hypothetical protein CBU02nite_26220 [Clostridium butyricum]
MGFDKKLFAELLEKAKGDRSINKYAGEIDISPAHISRLLRQLIDTPPSPETISKFANGAYNEVSYNELMQAAGHINEKEDPLTDDSKVGKIKALEKKFLQVIVSELYSSDIEWSMNKINNEYLGLAIEIKNGEYSKWLIELKSFSSIKSLYFIYGQIALFDLAPDIKLTLAVSTEKEFNLFFNKPPKSLRANLFVMLVDLDAGKIIKEEKLCHF